MHYRESLDEWPVPWLESNSKMVMMWLREDWHDDSRFPEMMSISTLLSPASEACAWAGAAPSQNPANAQQRWSEQLTVVDTDVECCGNGKRKKGILTRVFHDSHDKTA